MYLNRSPGGMTEGHPGTKRASSPGPGDSERPIEGQQVVGFSANAHCQVKQISSGQARHSVLQTPGVKDVISLDRPHVGDVGGELQGCVQSLEPVDRHVNVEELLQNLS